MLPTPLGPLSPGMDEKNIGAATHSPVGGMTNEGLNQLRLEEVSLGAEFTRQHLCLVIHTQMI